MSRRGSDHGQAPTFVIWHHQPIEVFHSIDRGSPSGGPRLQRSTGAQEGDSEDERGLSITGVSAEWVSMAQFRCECGKIAKIWAVADDLDRLQRQGIITAEELATADAMATPAP